MQVKKLKEIPYGNAFVEIANKNTFYLWSYRTLVAKVGKRLAYDKRFILNDHS